MGRDPNIWEDAKSFRPERWLQPGASKPVGLWVSGLLGFFGKGYSDKNPNILTDALDRRGGTAQL